MVAALSLPGRTRRRRRLGALVAFGVAAIGLGRFVTHTGSDSAERATSVAAAPTSGNVAARVASFEAAVRDRPEDPRAWPELATLYVRRAFETGDTGFYALASRAVDEAVRLAPDAQASRLAAATLALARHDFEEAERLGRLAVAAEPLDADALTVVVDAAIELGDYDGAAVDLQRLLDARPDVRGLTRLSYLRELNGDVSGALLAMTQALEAATTPIDVATVAAYLGDLQFGVGRLAEAEGSYRIALDRAPGLPLAELGLARVDAALDHRDAAVTRLRIVTDRFPLPAALALLGDLLVLDGDSAAAEDAFAVVRAQHRLFEANGGTADLELALFEADHGDPITAVGLASAAYAARATVFTADAKAWALFRSGSPGEARPLAEEALRLGTSDATLLYHAAAILAADGEDNRAATLLAESFRLNPWFAFHLIDEATRLADDLGVALPEAWSAR